MVKKEKEQEEKRESLILPSKIYFEDPVTKEKGYIESPTMISLFWSDNFRKKYNEDPKQEWSIKELMECMVIKPRSASTLRKNIDSNQHIFVKFKGIRERIGEGGLISINLIKFKPITKFIIDALKEMIDDGKK
jgi:hypothetical protein